MEIRSTSTDALLAIVVFKKEIAPQAVHFHTVPTESLQVAKMSRPAGFRVAPHRHKPVERRIVGTAEVIIVTGGSALLEVFDETGASAWSGNIREGDLAALFAGGHSLEMGPDGARFYEIKQGPYLGRDADKEEFDAGT